MTRSDFERRLKEYRFYHSIEVEPGLVTPGLPKVVPQQALVMRNLRSLPLTGRRVLDVGCRDGLFSFEAERLGAREVVGVDNDLSEGSTQLLIPYLNSKVRMYGMNLFDLTPESFGKFDLVIFSGVLYHLRYPVHALKILKDLLVDGGTLLLETAILPAWERHPLLYCPTGAESPYESTSVAFFNDKGMRSTLTSLGYEVVSSDRLYGRRRPSRAAITIGLQRVLPGLAHRLFGRFTLDRRVFVCRSRAGEATLAAYWDATHGIHSAGAGWH